MNSTLAKKTDFAHFDEPLERSVLEQLAYNEKMAELGQLAAGLVHELNTPLSVLNSAAQMILREDDLSDFVREMVERINLETQRLSQYTRGLLSFSRRDDATVGEVNLSQVLNDVMAFLRYETQKRSIQVIEDLDYNLPLVEADVNHLKQIFINLIMNALQAMEDGGTLRLHTALLNKTTVEARIADTGSGIPADKVDKIFEPFYTTKGPGVGTGLGLFVTRKIVNLYEGRVSVTSVPGQGTTFLVAFPVIPDERLQGASRAAKGSAHS